MIQIACQVKEAESEKKNHLNLQENLVGGEVILEWPINYVAYDHIISR